MSKAKRRNPYNANRPASADVFVGREKLKGQLARGLPEGKCFELIGGPGIGKTSLLMAVQRDLASQQAVSRSHSLPLPIYVACQRSHTRAEAVVAAILHGLADALQVQRQLSCPVTLLNQAQAEADRGRLEASLDVLLRWAFAREARTHRPLVLLDDLHRLSGNNSLPQLASLLQTPLNQQGIGLGLVLASQQPLADELRNDVSPLRILISQHNHLQPLSRKEAQTLVAKASGCGWRVEDGCADLVYQMTGGHPYCLHYYLDGVLSQEKRLTAKGLNLFHNRSETKRHLDAVLTARPGTQIWKRPTVFISYSHKNESEKDRLISHLGVLQEAELVNVWCDDRIQAGADWQTEIDQAIAQASAAILLITADFLTSAFILRKEIPELLKRRQRDGLVVFPVIARDCAWNTVSWLTEMNVRPKNGKPVWSDNGSHVDEDLAKIAREILALVGRATQSGDVE